MYFQTPKSILQISSFVASGTGVDKSQRSNPFYYTTPLTSTHKKQTKPLFVWCQYFARKKKAETLPLCREWHWRDKSQRCTPAEAQASRAPCSCFRFLHLAHYVSTSLDRLLMFKMSIMISMWEWIIYLSILIMCIRAFDFWILPLCKYEYNVSFRYLNQC